MWAVTPPPEQELERLWHRLSVVDGGTVDGGGVAGYIYYYLQTGTRILDLVIACDSRPASSLSAAPKTWRCQERGCWSWSERVLRAPGRDRFFLAELT